PENLLLTNHIHQTIVLESVANSSSVLLFVFLYYIFFHTEHHLFIQVTSPKTHSHCLLFSDIPLYVLLIYVMCLRFIFYVTELYSHIITRCCFGLCPTGVRVVLWMCDCS